MAKIITSRHRATETERARQYIKSRLMLPTIPLAMVTLLTGYGSLAFMWFQDSLTLQALGASMVLFVAGAALGWGQVRYDRYLVRTCPEYLAGRQKVLDAAKEYKRPKRGVSAGGPQHPGRRVVLLAYALGIMGMLALSIIFMRTVGVYAAFFVPWAGYLNAKVVLWRQLFIH